VADDERDMVDRGIGTMADCSSLADLSKIASFFAAEETETGWELRTDGLMAFALCCRGQQLRLCKLSTIGSHHAPLEGVNGVTAVRTVWWKSKRNQYGNREETAFIRYVLLYATV
jgi:hypothetical protein